MIQTTTLEERIDMLCRTANNIGRSVRADTSLVHRIFYRVTKLQPQEDVEGLMERYRNEIDSIIKSAEIKITLKRADVNVSVADQEALQSTIESVETDLYEKGFVGNGSNYRAIWEGDHKQYLARKRLSNDKECKELLQADEGTIRIQAQAYEELIDHAKELEKKKLRQLEKAYETTKEEMIYTNTLRESLDSFTKATRELRTILKIKNKLIKARSKESVLQTISDDENLASVTAKYLPSQQQPQY